MARENRVTLPEVPMEALCKDEMWLEWVDRVVGGLDVGVCEPKAGFSA
jgi:hypothetical protein